MKKMKKMAEGGAAGESEYSSERNKRLTQIESIARKDGQKIGNERQEEAQLRSAPRALINRGVDYLKDKALDVDANVSEKIGLDRRAADKRGLRKGLKDEGYKKGGKVSSASSRGDGCAVKGKTKGTMITMKNGGKC
jgi:hypothetical protein